MPVPINDIERKIEEISLILDNYEPLCLIIGKEKVNHHLHITSNNLAELLDKEIPLSIEYFAPIVRLIEQFNKIEIIIPQELNNALCNTLSNFEHNYYSDELQETVIQYIEKLDILGVDAY
ncbi:hypothetical protein [Rickettsia asembonensis]|uniref:Uncharacterized protein n=1 Tax=Rickettsia asembonensis TaxID=1068590 RepID=A0A0C2LXY8_9RICK|nr:hypothetical protein [Rickettsia asembonensis]KIJ88282.1 hypothetical protein SB78_06745 [Rickettsia asembonensis]WCR57193.1 MAG: hypothetical protein PG979_001250 [Rickettsia asembonensis]